MIVPEAEKLTIPTRTSGAYRVRPVDPAQWDGLLQRFPARTAFHHLAWLKSVEESEGIELLLRQVEQGGECVAVWPCLEVKKGPLRVLGSPLPGWSTVYLGPLFAPTADVPAAVQAFFEDSRFRRAAYIYCKVCDVDREVDLGPVGFGTPVARYETYLLSLNQTEEELWANLNATCRRKIRKAEKLNMVTRRETDTSFVDDFWKMSLEIFSRSNIKPVFSRRLLECVARNLMADGRLLVMSVFLEERRIATLVLPHDDRTMYFWQGGSFDEFRPASPGNLMHWSAIQEARRMGLQCYDLVSVYGGPGEFKKSFGGVESATATHWERYRSPVVKLLKKAYEYHLRRRQRTG